MRFLCLSDIHAYADALRAALTLGHEYTCNRVLVAGDLCFPGPDPLATWKLLTTAQAVCTQGLVDRALATINVESLQGTNAFEYERINRLRTTRRALGELIMARLSRLPVTTRMPLANGGEQIGRAHV